jgi:protoporphyrinogen oxidase
MKNLDKEFGYNSTFYYPQRGGVQALIRAMAPRTKSLLQARVMRINLQNKMVMIDGAIENTPRRIHYDNLINTLPLRTFARMVADAPAEVTAAASRLRATSVYNLNLGIKRENVGGGRHWIYYPEAQFPFYRAGFPHTFAPLTVPPGCSSVYVECAHNPADGPIVMPRLKRECIRGLTECGILREDDEILAQVELVIPTAYVIFDKARTPNVNLIMDYLKENGVHTLGRYGKWHYSFIEAAVLEGKVAAEAILGK